MGSSFASIASESFRETLSEMGVSSKSLGDPKRLGRQAALTVTAGATWKKHLGPLLDAKQVQELIGVGTRQAVSDLRRRKRLIGLLTRDGHVLYPAFQFGPGGRRSAQMPLVLSCFEKARTDLWTVASWFVTPQPTLKGHTPAEELMSGSSPGLIVRAARRTAAQLSR